MKTVAERSATHGIQMKDKIGYALGDMGNMLSFGLVGAFLQMFYSDVMHISLGKIGVLMLVARIWDAVNDPMWGMFIDSRKPTRFGKFRPYVLWASFPMALGAVLMFVKIPGLTENQYLIYAYVTYIFYGMMYTGANIPYGSLASVITDDEAERSELSMFRSIGAGVGGVPAQILLPLVVYSVAVDTGEKYLDGNKLLAAVAAMMGCSIIVFLFHFKLTKERVGSPSQPPKFRVWHTVKTLLRNGPFVVLCLASMLHIGVTMYVQTIYNYLFKNYFGRPELFSLVTICTYAPMIVLLPFLTKLVRRFGKKSICASGLLLSAVANGALWLLRTHNPYVFLAMSFASGLGIMFITMEIWALATDVIDYQEYLSHSRDEGTSYAFFSFTRKLGHTLAGTGASFILALIGYDVNAASAQSPAVLEKMYTISTLVPTIVYLLMFLLLAFLYPLGKERVAKLHDDLAAQRAGVLEEEETI